MNTRHIHKSYNGYYANNDKECVLKQYWINPTDYMNNLKESPGIIFIYSLWVVNATVKCILYIYRRRIIIYIYMVYTYNIYIYIYTYIINSHMRISPWSDFSREIHFGGSNLITYPSRLINGATLLNEYFWKLNTHLHSAQFALRNYILIYNNNKIFNIFMRIHAHSTWIKHIIYLCTRAK